VPAPDVPDVAVQRLPLYLRALTFLRDEGQRVTSSHALASRLRLSPAQIRKDLSYFGEFGKQGSGYDIAYLIEQIKHILNLNREWGVALVGAGHLGRAIAHYGGFRPKGFHIAVVFDNDSHKIGQQIGGLVVQDSANLVPMIRELGLQIAIIAVPAQASQAVADALVSAGVKALLNYAPVTLHVPPDVRVYHLDPVVGLQTMTYYLRKE